MWKAPTLCIVALLLIACSASSKPQRHNTRDHVVETNTRPPWDDEQAAKLVGARVLIGLTRTRADGSDLEQMFGRVRSVSADDGFEVELEGVRAGETYWLPPHLDAFEPAAPGEYRLRSSGEVVVNPDYITSWVVEAPPD